MNECGLLLSLNREQKLAVYLANGLDGGRVQGESEPMVLIW